MLFSLSLFVSRIGCDRHRLRWSCFQSDAGRYIARYFNTRVRFHFWLELCHKLFLRNYRKHTG